MVNYLKLNSGSSKTHGAIKDALMNQLSNYWSEGFIITTVISDGEHVLTSLSDNLKNIGVRHIVNHSNRNGVAKLLV